MRSIALAVLLPFAAFAQTPTPEAAPPVAVAVPEPAAPSQRGPEWSLGAGIQATNVYIFNSGSASLAVVSRPTATASLERRLSGRTWLVIGLDASYDRSDADNGLGSSEKDEFVAGQLGVGIRGVVSPQWTPVDVSLVALATGGTVRLTQRTESGGASQEAEQRVWSVGAEGGIAIDRALTGGLSLRVATPLLTASWSSGTMRAQAGAPESTSTRFVAQAALAPRLELRLAF